MARPLILRGTSQMLGLLRELDAACFREPLSRVHLAGFLQQPAGEVPGCWFLGVPEEDGGYRPVAFLLIRLVEELWLIERIGVHPDQRRRHFAAALLAAAATAGQRKRTWLVQLPEQDLASQTFFRHMGFRAHPASDRSRRFFGEQDAVVMTRGG